MSSHEKWLRNAAAEIAAEGHAGWGNTCTQAADAIAELQARADRLTKANKVLELKCSASLANNLCPDHRDKQTGKPCLACTIAALQSWQESTAIYLADADRALSVLFTMLTKIGQKEGAIVADETRANVRAAMKEVAHSKSTAQPLPGGMQRDKMPGECAPIWPPEPEKLGGEQS